MARTDASRRGSSSGRPGPCSEGRTTTASSGCRSSGTGVTASSSEGAPSEEEDRRLKTAMTNVVVDLGMALICFMGSCHPALVGTGTPTGEFRIEHYTTNSRGYGGDVLVFVHDTDRVLAIHRVFRVAGQRRIERLQSDDPRLRKNITNGCINVDPAVYDQLVECCSTSKLIIHR